MCKNDNWRSFLRKTKNTVSSSSEIFAKKYRYTPRASCNGHVFCDYFFSNILEATEKIRWDTYAHTIWASRCVHWLTAPTVMSQPGTFHTLHQEIYIYFPLKTSECDQNSMRDLPHRKCRHWQSLERNCTAVEHFQVWRVFCWPYIWDPMISQSTSRPLILWVLGPAMKSMANHLFWDLRKLIKYSEILDQWQWLRCCRPLRSVYWSPNKMNMQIRRNSRSNEMKERNRIN